MADLEDRGRALEEQWFRENEKDLLAAARARREAQLAAEKTAEEKRLRDLHYMKCPKDGNDMQQVEHEGVAIDRCPRCQGIFLDAGELETILGKSHDERRTIFRRLAGLFSA